METIHPVDYVLVLSTGERITVAEFDPERIPCMQSHAVMDAATDALSRCTFAPRIALEEAKKGHDARLRPLLRTPPVGALLKLALHVCNEKKSCSMFDAKKCTTKNITQTGGGFPECWESPPDTQRPHPFTVESQARGLTTAIVHAWRQGMYAIVVEP